MNLTQIKRGIISPALMEIGLYSDTALNLATGTGLVKSGFSILPASSTDTCTQGQIEVDADYIYSCVATNTWHRVSNGATW